MREVLGRAISLKAKQFGERRGGHLDPGQVFVRLGPISDRPRLPVQMPFPRLVQTIRRVLNVIARVIFLVRRLRIAGKSHRVPRFIHASYLEPKIRPREQGDHFHFPVIDPFFFDVAGPERKLGRFVLRTGSLNIEEPCVRRAGALFAFSIHEQLTEIPTTVANQGHFRRPLSGLVGPYATSPARSFWLPAAEYRIFPGIGGDDQRMDIVGPGILRPDDHRRAKLVHALPHQDFRGAAGPFLAPRPRRLQRARERGQRAILAIRGRLGGQAGPDIPAAGGDIKNQFVGP